MADVNLAKEINKVLGVFSADVDAAVKEATEETASVTKFVLANTSPRRRGDYAKSWFIKKTASNAHYYKVVVANKRYQLTHLLEYGHNIVAHGVVVGHAQAKPHIADAEKMAQEYFEKAIEEKINKS